MELNEYTREQAAGSNKKLDLPKGEPVKKNDRNYNF
jgi:hypothetical protein